MLTGCVEGNSRLIFYMHTCEDVDKGSLLRAGHNPETTHRLDNISRQVSLSQHQLEFEAFLQLGSVCFDFKLGMISSVAVSNSFECVATI